MKKTWTKSALLCTWVALYSAGAAHATDYPFSFNADDLLKLYPATAAGDKTTQDNARKLTGSGQPVMTWTSSFGQTASVYDTPAFNGVSQPGAYNTYLNWRDGLGTNEGIFRFNLLFAPSGAGEPSRTGFRSWGTRLLASPTSQVTATAPPGWTVDTQSPFPGYIGAQWTSSSLDPLQYIRPGASHPLFSFAVTDLLWDADGDGIGDRPAGPGDLARAFFGADGLVFDANGWGTRPGYAPFGSGPNPTWEGVLVLQVPEPSGLWLAGLCAAALAWRRLGER